MQWKTKKGFGEQKRDLENFPAFKYVKHVCQIADL